MEHEFRYRGRADAQIVNGVLYIPREVEDFHKLMRAYVLQEEETEGYRYLGVYPKDELIKDLLSEGNANKRLPNKFVPLEKVVRRDGTKGLRLPPHFLEYLHLERNSTTKIIGGGGPYFEVWKPEDFEKYESLADLEGVMSALAEREIHPTL